MWSFFITMIYLLKLIEIALKENMNVFWIVMNFEKARSDKYANEPERNCHVKASQKSDN